MSRCRALTLLELLVVIAVIGVGGVGVSKLVAHALRIAERAERRSELTMAAHAALEQARVEVTRGQPLTPERTTGLIRVRITGAPASPPLAAVTASARFGRALEPLEVTLTGWAISREAPSP